MGSCRVGISCVNDRILYRTRSRKVTATAGGWCKAWSDMGQSLGKMDRQKAIFVPIIKFEVIETGRVTRISNRGVSIRIFDVLWV